MEMTDEDIMEHEMDAMLNLASENVAIARAEGDVPAIDCHAFEAIYGTGWLVEVRVRPPDRHPCIGTMVFINTYPISEDGRLLLAYHLGKIGVMLDDPAMFHGDGGDVGDFLANEFLADEVLEQASQNVQWIRKL